MGVAKGCRWAMRNRAWRNASSSGRLGWIDTVAGAVADAVVFAVTDAAADAVAEPMAGAAAVAPGDPATGATPAWHNASCQPLGRGRPRCAMPSAVRTQAITGNQGLARPLGSCAGAGCT